MNPTKPGLQTSEMWTGVTSGFAVYEIATSGPSMPQAVCAFGLALIACAYALARSRTKSPAVIR